MYKNLAESGFPKWKTDLWLIWYDMAWWLPLFYYCAELYSASLIQEEVTIHCTKESSVCNFNNFCWLVVRNSYCGSEYFLSFSGILLKCYLIHLFHLLSRCKFIHHHVHLYLKLAVGEWIPWGMQLLPHGFSVGLYHQHVFVLFAQFILFIRVIYGKGRQYYTHLNSPFNEIYFPPCYLCFLIIHIFWVSAVLFSFTVFFQDF